LTYQKTVCSTFRRYAWKTRSTAAAFVFRRFIGHARSYRAAGERSARPRRLARPNRGILRCRRHQAIPGPRRLVRYKLEPDRRLLRRQPRLRQLLGDAGSRATGPDGRSDRRALHQAHQDGADGSGLDRGNSSSRRFVDLAAVPSAAAPHRRQPDVGSVSRGSDNCDDRSGARGDRRCPLAYLSGPHQALPAHARILRRLGDAAPRRRFCRPAALERERLHCQLSRASDAPVARERSVPQGTGFPGFRGSDTQLRARHRQQSGRSGSNHGRYQTCGLGSRSKIKAGSGASAICSRCPLRSAGCASNRCSTE